MKNFLMGALGAFVILIAAAIIVPQYSTYRGQAEISRWFVNISETQQEIEKQAISLNTVIGAGQNIKIPAYFNDLNYSQITSEGIIFLKGGIKGQFITLIPSFENGKITWQCIGGSDNNVPTKCKPA